MKNFDIVQVPHSYSFILGFYGKCVSSNSDCTDYDLLSSDFREIVDSVYEVDSSQNGTSFLYYKSDLYNTSFNHFDKLVCGKSYYFVVRPGVSRITIPHLYVNNTDSNLQGRITESCNLIDTTPTPESMCCLNFNNSLFLNGSPTGTESLNGVKAFMFEYGAMFCYDSLDLTYYPSRYNFKSNDGNVLGYITTTGRFKNKKVRYTSKSGVCYEGNVETENGFNILTPR